MAFEFIHCQPVVAFDCVVVTVKHCVDAPAISNLTPFRLFVLVVSGTFIRTHTWYWVVSGTLIVEDAVPSTLAVEHIPEAACDDVKKYRPTPAKKNGKVDIPIVRLRVVVFVIFAILVIMGVLGI